MIEILGWICTGLVLLGYFQNAIGRFKIAMIIWIIGDAGWIYYDYHISNWSHALLSSIVILINIYGYNRNKIKNAYISKKSAS